MPPPPQARRARASGVGSRVRKRPGCRQPSDEGQSDRGIARTLGISTRTVQAHLQHTYRALDVTSRTEAVARLRALGATSGLSRPGRLARW